MTKIILMAMANMNLIGVFVTKVMACTSVGVRRRRRQRNQKHNITKIFKFRGYYGFGPEPSPPPPSPSPSPPPHAKACVSRNCDTNAHIKFIIDTAIDTLEWKNPIDFGENRKTKMAAKRPFCENMMKKLVHSITSSKMHRSTSYLI